MTKTELRHTAYEAAVRAAIAAAPSITSAERERLSRVWRASGSELIFSEQACRAT